MARRTGSLVSRLLKRMAKEDDALRDMTWRQWVPVWLGCSAFVFLGTIGRARYVDEQPWGEAIIGGLGGIGLVTVLALVLWAATR